MNALRALATSAPTPRPQAVRPTAPHREKSFLTLPRVQIRRTASSLKKSRQPVNPIRHEREPTIPIP